MSITIATGASSRPLEVGQADGCSAPFPQRFKPRLQRITLTEQLMGTAEGQKALVIDISLSGVLIAHQFPSDIGRTVRLRFDWRGEATIADCEVMRSKLHAPPVRAGARAVYRSGVAFMRFIDGSESILRSMIAELVTRALDEQKANARGIPPNMASSIQTGRRSRGYLTLRMVGGAWQRLESVHAVHPEDGFTISIEEDPAQIDLLCEAWERVGPAHRNMIREMARMSIANQDGIPARRYEP